MPSTLLVVLSHPDDELALAGTILAQRARGDRVVLAWLTRGEMTEALGPLPVEDVAARREEQGAEAAHILGVEHRFLSFPDTRLEATPAAAREVARLVAEVRPDGLVTWGDAWVRGARHPDHQATGKIARDAVTLARIAKLVEPLPPHRAPCPAFTLRDFHSVLPAVVVDVSGHLEGIFALADFHRRTVGFGERGWLERRLARVGRPWGIAWGEAFDAWESRPGVARTLLPADPADLDPHPARENRDPGGEG